MWLKINLFIAAVTVFKQESINGEGRAIPFEF